MKLKYKELEIELAFDGIIQVESICLEEGLNRHAFLSMKLLVEEEETENIVTMTSVQPVVITENRSTSHRRND